MENEMAKRIAELRKQNGLTLEEVANIVGVGKSTVRKWETGMIANMRKDKIALLAKALRTTPAYLMGWDSPANVYECPDEENPWILRSNEAMEKLPLDIQKEVSVYLESIAEGKANPPGMPELTEGEIAILELFRKVPKDKQDLVLSMIRVALEQK